jgi:formylglycine-generating enzyme required for sulfatase activity
MLVDSAAGCLQDRNLDRIAWYCHNSGNELHPVGLLEPNDWGLFDVAGNAYEWTTDTHDGAAAQGGTNPGAQLKQGAGSRHLRGGGFNSRSHYARAAWRTTLFHTVRSPAAGFRLVRSLD